MAKMLKWHKHNLEKVSWAPIGSKAAANLFRDGVDFNLQVVLLKNCTKLTC